MFPSTFIFNHYLRPDSGLNAFLSDLEFFPPRKIIHCHYRLCRRQNNLLLKKNDSSFQSPDPSLSLMNLAAVGVIQKTLLILTPHNSIVNNHNSTPYPRSVCIIYQNVCKTSTIFSKGNSAESYFNNNSSNCLDSNRNQDACRYAANTIDSLIQFCQVFVLFGFLFWNNRGRGFGDRQRRSRRSRRRNLHWSLRFLFTLHYDYDLHCRSTRPRLSFFSQWQELLTE